MAIFCSKKSQEKRQNKNSALEKSEKISRERKTLL
jgi:hypothetical protein